MNPKISIVVPFHWMKNWQFFLTRCLESIEKQTFKDYEIIITKAGKMAENTNAGIKKATGEIIKILYLDDYLTGEKSLEYLVVGFKGGWLATACYHDNGNAVGNYHEPSFSGILEGINTIGSPSVIAFENKEPLLFDEKMSWLLDVDYYQRLFKRYGGPTLLTSADTTIGMHGGQMTFILSDAEKLAEERYLLKKNGE